MKRFLCIALLMMVFAFGGMAEGASGGLPSIAEPGATQAPAGFTEADAPYAGAWLPFEDGFRLYLPRGWASMALTDAQMAAGLFYRAGSPDGSMSFVVGFMPAGKLVTLDDLARDFEGVGYSSVTRCSLNGLPAIAFERPQDGYCGVAFFHPVYPDYVLYVYVSPFAPRDDDAARVGAALLASIGPWQAPQERLKNN